ncbi:hypothetical protein CO051_03225 [Candidatus Roizmanbacteria bacterium CG_4_9_14_0_2_um_filter_39_13]|uniref:UDP-N-acetylglucosamine 1-carboxyvinyltransferase n=1 Tax=Candidatus Roizmanbacteria bacterium CG_4_9_14_0_2_um_filter_39_13 TaxID=1974839 RepID=A0A2M8EZJ3_9BACT|nr:MAG: hypothetical protein COY15_02210 [Candidatus Roizmanbacteria bacterium CG_4_10_14_0_2_um_filter_39_12]PJC32455.1 MAG: hypothetical protein CO051_03225 [Candidatus Roizmanbacteria bacterium CG_4_9_14_0_2_um_filter_39_13]
MEDAYVITGGKKLAGEIHLSGAKNIALKVIIAALMFESEVILHNIPRIQDIHELIHLLELLGVKVEFDGSTVKIDPKNITSNTVDLLHASKIRVSFLLFAPLLHTFGTAIIPNPGGCRLGARSIDRVIDGLKSLGVKVDYDSETGYYNAEMKGDPTGGYRFDKPSHTGTELMIMMSVFGKQTIKLENVAQEPEIDDLIAMLNEGGAKIRREELDIIIDGVERLVQVRPFEISSDRVEAITYAVAGIASGGDVTISTISERYIKSFNDVLEKTGAGVDNLGNGKWRYYAKSLRCVDIETGPFPGFLTDWQPLYAVLMTQAEGYAIIHERIFENRFSYVEELMKLGATIRYVEKNILDPSEHYHFTYDPVKVYAQTIEVSGHQDLHGGVLTVSDLRAGATLAIAALIADNTSYIKGVSHIDRGYENFVEKVRMLGGDIREI